MSSEQKLPGIQLKELVGRVLSPDGKTASLVFRKPDGGEFVVSFPAEIVAMVRGTANALAKDLHKRDFPPGQMALFRVKNVATGEHDAIRGCTLLQIEPGTVEEVTYVVPDNLGRQIADAMHRDIYRRMTPADRAASGYSKTFNPDAAQQKRTLILPPGMR